MQISKIEIGEFLDTPERCGSTFVLIDAVQDFLNAQDWWYDLGPVTAELAGEMVEYQGHTLTCLNYGWWGYHNIRPAKHKWDRKGVKTRWEKTKTKFYIGPVLRNGEQELWYMKAKYMHYHK